MNQIITISWNKLAVMLALALALLENSGSSTAKQHYPSSYGCGINLMLPLALFVSMLPALAVVLHSNRDSPVVAANDRR